MAYYQTMQVNEDARVRLVTFKSTKKKKYEDRSSNSANLHISVMAVEKACRTNLTKLLFINTHFGQQGETMLT